MELSPSLRAHLDALAPYLEDKTVSEVLVAGPDQVLVSRGAVAFPIELELPETRIRALTERLARALGGHKSERAELTTGRLGELFVTLVGAFKANTTVALFATTGVVLSAAYALWLYRRVVFGELEKKSLMDIEDLNSREIFILAPLVAATIFFGFYPKPIFDMTGNSVQATIDQMEGKLKTADTRTAPGEGVAP